MSSDLNPSYVGLRTDLLSLITGSNLDVLDVGCSTGINGQYLKEKGMARFVAGLELDFKMARLAANVLDEVFCGNIEVPEARYFAARHKYDYIILGDVLEHLSDPSPVLRELAMTLKVGGRAIICVPNIRHIDVFIHIFLKKTWPRNARGIFDTTHKSFFTKHDLETMIMMVGLKPALWIRKFRYRDAIGSRFPWHGRLLKKCFPDLFTFQHIVVAEKPVR